MTKCEKMKYNEIILIYNQYDIRIKKIIDLLKAMLSTNYSRNVTG